MEDFELISFSVPQSPNGTISFDQFIGENNVHQVSDKEDNHNLDSALSDVEKLGIQVNLRLPTTVTDLEEENNCVLNKWKEENNDISHFEIKKEIVDATNPLLDDERESKKKPTPEKIEVQKFLESDPESIPVRTLRNLVTDLLRLNFYNHKYTNGLKKVHYMWKNKPEGWPSTIPFIDPNNGERDSDGKKGRKPKKTDLMLMFVYLKGLYKMAQKKGEITNKEKLKIKLDEKKEAAKINAKVMRMQKQEERKRLQLVGDIDIQSSDMEQVLAFDPKDLDVKTLRTVIPKMYMKCFFSPEELKSTTNKLKQIWNHRPVDWPVTIPFADPNNGKSGQKPKKPQLVETFNFLKNKYRELCHGSSTYQPTEAAYQTTTPVPSPVHFEEVCSPESYQPAPSPGFYQDVYAKGIMSPLANQMSGITIYDHNNLQSIMSAVQQIPTIVEEEEEVVKEPAKTFGGYDKEFNLNFAVKEEVVTPQGMECGFGDPDPLYPDFLGANITLTEDSDTMLDMITSIIGEADCPIVV